MSHWFLGLKEIDWSEFNFGMALRTKNQLCSRAKEIEIYVLWIGMWISNFIHWTRHHSRSYFFTFHAAKNLNFPKNPCRNCRRFLPSSFFVYLIRSKFCRFLCAFCVSDTIFVHIWSAFIRLLSIWYDCCPYFVEIYVFCLFETIFVYLLTIDSVPRCIHGGQVVQLLRLRFPLLRPPQIGVLVERVVQRLRYPGVGHLVVGRWRPYTPGHFFVLRLNVEFYVSDKPITILPWINLRRNAWTRVHFYIFTDWTTRCFLFTTEESTICLIQIRYSILNNIKWRAW